MYKWNLQPKPPAEFLNNHPELPTTIAQLLWNRNLKTPEEIDEFLNPDYTTDIHDPFLFKDMSKAVKIIFKAIAKQHKIVVHGDYDADGVSASAVIINGLRKLGSKNVEVYIPHRETEGYGLNIKTVEKLAKAKTDLLITCDCGVGNVEEVNKAKKLGLQVIVTDHHSIPEITPKADAIIHPKMPKEKYPDKMLCGAAVGFKLIQALLIEHKKKNPTLPDGQLHEGFEKWLLDMVAIATIGDMVPLLGESRTLTKYGMMVLNKTQNLGLQELIKLSTYGKDKNKKTLTATNVSFQIVPRLNAAGRMEHANTAFELLMATQIDEAERLAKKLNTDNTERQKLTEKMVKLSITQIESGDQMENPILFVIEKDWPTGLLGLIAGRVKDCYNKPIIAMTKRGGAIHGSGRSIAEFNIIEALQEMPEYFEKFGGHPQACGLTLSSPEVLEDFKKDLIKKAVTKTKDVELVPQIDVDSEVELENVDWKLYDLLQRFAPFGQANPEPKYVARNLTLTEVSPVGQTGKHLRLMVKHNSQKVRKTIGFGLGDACRHPENWKENLKAGDNIDMVFSIGVNEWNGNRELQLTIEDIKKH